MAALNYGHKGVAFVCNTSSGDQTISLSGGPGKTPKWVILLMSRATALDTITTNAYVGFGATDGTNDYAVCGMAESGVVAANADTGGRIDNGAVIQITGTTAEGKEARATRVSLGTDQIVINWATGEVPVSAYRGYAIFGYGDDMTAVVTTITSSAVSAGTAASTALGATPDYVIAASVAQAFAADTGFNEELLCVGFSGRAPSITNGCSFNFAEDRQSNTASANLGRNDAILGAGTLIAGVSAETARLSVTSYDTNGITVTNALTGVALQGIYVLVRVGGQKAWTGAPTLNADTTGSMSITNPGFHPGFLMVSATRCATSGTIVASGQLSVGFATPTEQGCVSMHARHNQGTSSTQTFASSSKVLDVLSTGSAHDWVADFTQFDATGATLNVSTAAAADRVTALLFVEAAPAEILPSGIATATAFGTAVVAPGAVNIAPTGIATANAFGTAVVTAGAVDIAPTGIATANAFGTAVVTAGAVDIAPTGIATATTFGTAVVTAGAVDIAPTGIATANAFGTATLSSDIAPAGIASATEFGTAVVTAGAVDIAPTGIASANAFGDAVVTQGSLIQVSGIASATLFGTAVLSVGAVDIAPAGIASATAFGNATLVAAGVQDIAPAGIATANTFGTAVVAPGAVDVAPAGIASATAFGSASVTAGAVDIAPAGIASATAFGTATLTLSGVQDIAPAGIATANAFGTAVVALDVVDQDISPAGIASSTKFGFPFVQGGFLRVTMKKRIHDALCERAHLASFIAVTYPVDDEGCVLEQGALVQPRSVEVNEVRSASSVEGRHGREFVLDRQRWTWEMTLRFDQEVVAELFETSLDDAPVMVCQDPSDPTSRQARLSRVDCEYRHPPRGNPSNGSELRYRFEAVLSPK